MKEIQAEDDVEVSATTHRTRDRIWLELSEIGCGQGTAAMDRFILIPTYKLGESEKTAETIVWSRITLLPDCQAKFLILVDLYEQLKPIVECQRTYQPVDETNVFQNSQVSSSESSEDAERWQAVFAAVTDSELRFYESAPWSGESWKMPAEGYALIATRLVGPARRQYSPEFSIRCATVEGVVTHQLRAETHRDLAVWAKTLVNGSYASAVTQREFVCSRVYVEREPTQLVIHYENGFTLLESDIGSHTLWRHSFDQLRHSSDDGKRMLFLDFGGSGEESEVELDVEVCLKPIVFILHNFLSVKLHRLGLYA